MPKGVTNAQTPAELFALFCEKLNMEKGRVLSVLESGAVETLIQQEFARLTQAVDRDDPLWRADLPGRAILGQFAAKAQIQSGRLKQLYLRVADMDHGPFQELIAIFSEFQKQGSI